MMFQKQMRALHIRMSRWTAVASLALLGLAGCGGGVSTAPTPAGPNNQNSGYNGPPAADKDIQAFGTELWEFVRAPDKCGGCHNAGGQSPQFARSDDVNLAFQQVGRIINRQTPSLSLMVTKVGGGHNCWVSDLATCANILTRLITNWVGAADLTGKQIELIEPRLRDPGSSKRFPSDPPAQFQNVYTLLDRYCSGCHQADSPTAQSPYFAAGGLPGGAVDITSQAYREAYLAAIPKINLDKPDESRFVIRLGRESHNCWSNCSANAQELRDAIRAMADAIPKAPIDPSLTLSKALTLYDGTV